MDAGPTEAGSGLIWKSSSCHHTDLHGCLVGRLRASQQVAGILMEPIYGRSAQKCLHDPKAISPAGEIWHLCHGHEYRPYLSGE